MASSLSDDEFQRIQSQLLDLRASNYELDDRCKKQARELQSLKAHADQVDNDLQKANKALQKSKKAKEFEALMQENEGLQRKLASQEDDFRLQNEVLMKELADQISANEALEREKKSMAEDESVKHVSEETEDMMNQIRHLTAQNTALQRSIAGYKDRREKEITQQEELQAAIEDSTDIVDDTKDRIQTEPMDPLNSLDSGSSIGDHVTESVNCSDVIAKSEIEQSNDFIDLKLNLDTEKEENKLLREQLQSLEKSHAEKIMVLQDEVDKLTEKFKKKQESLVHLQEEKEAMFSELSGKLESLTITKTSEVETLQAHASQLEQQLIHSSKVMDDFRDKSQKRISELEETVGALQAQVNGANEESRQQAAQQSDIYEQQLELLRQQLAAGQQLADDLRLQLQESQKANQTSLDQLFAMQEERDTQIQTLQQANQVAEKRKCLLDELAMKYQTQSDSHRSQLKELDTVKQLQAEQLEKQGRLLQEKDIEVRKLSDKVETLTSELGSMDVKIGSLQQRLSEAEERYATSQTQFEHDLASTRQTHAETTDALTQQHEASVFTLQQEHSEHIQKLTLEIEKLESVKTDHQEQLQQLQQEVKDGFNDKKLHEKKGASVLRDLKKQLHLERKRSAKLQERLQQVLQLDSTSRQSIDELLTQSNADRYKGEGSSVSSWSGGNTSKESKDFGQTGENECGTLEQDNAELMTRVNALQQENVNLDVKVAHLETSNAAMAEDLLAKTAIIRHYIMESRPDHTPTPTTADKMTLKRVMEFVIDKGDENLREMNRKLQRMVEETLTKNMHLQQDLETLSQEVVRLSKTGAASCMSSST